MGHVLLRRRPTRYRPANDVRLTGFGVGPLARARAARGDERIDIHRMRQGWKKPYRYRPTRRMTIVGACGSINTS